ncbi:MAG: hypothetical protein ACJAUG_002858 [Halioglobus sp.]|jgi:hypothetical protein
MTIISPQEYCSLASISNELVNDSIIGCGYAALPAKLLAAEQSVARENELAAYELNKFLCRTLLEQFTLTTVLCNWPEQFRSLYKEQLQRIEGQLSHEPDSYFSFSNDPFRKDLAILRHRLIPCGAEFAMPFSGVSRSLLIKDGWRQAGKFLRVMATCRGIKPFLELHMHPKHVTAFNPDGWMETYDNLADLLAVNPSFLGVQSTSWFLDPALEQVSPHLAYLRQVPELCGAIFLYAGGDDSKHSGALATSQTRRTLHAAGKYCPRLFTRIWPRQSLLQRGWRS